MSRTALPCRKLASFVCLVFIFQLCSGGSSKKGRIGIDLPKSEETSLAHSDRQSKNLFPFVWVTFQPTPCGNDNEGVCVQRGKCSKKGGSASGNCQDGFGECCTFMEQCNVNRTQVDVNQLVSSLKSPTTINTNSQCSFRFKKEPNICQIKLYFASVQMNGASPDGICETDKLRISNSVTVPNGFTTCGMLTGQHMYLTFGSQDSIEVTPILRGMASNYNIIATRIPCDSNRRVPDYCLQHHTTGTGMVKSLGFPLQQQSDQQYTVCVKPQPQSTGVRWMPCTSTNKAFDIISNLQGPSGPCTTDWVQLKGGDKICDEFTQTMSTWKPYDLLVNFDKTEFPPPPEPFFMPITGPCDLTNCGTTIYPMLECMCVKIPAGATTDTCQCTLNLGAIVGAPTPDFNNTGFCLEYSQL